MRSLGDSDPRQVGLYRVLAGLDTDQTGQVLLAASPDGRPVAVKLVSAHLAGDGGFPQRFARETVALRRLPGTYTAPVVDANPVESTPWLALAFRAGASMREIVDRGVLLGENEVLRLAAGLVDALAELHRVGLVHRDLTPAHVRLTDDGVHLLDFGVARALDRDISLVVGSPEFMSPEQASGQPVTPASDVFSLGALLHLAAVGRSPFAGATRADTLTLVTQAQPDLSPSLPARVRQLLAACLAKEPRQRPTLAQLRAVIGAVPPGAYPWPSLVRSIISEQQGEVARLLGPAVHHTDAPTTRIAPVVAAPAPPPQDVSRPRRRPEPDDEPWRPDLWAVVSGGAVVVTVVFAIIMFNTLTPDQPITASQQRTSTPPTTTPPTTTPPPTTLVTTTTTTQQSPLGEVTGLAGKCMDVAGARSDNGAPVQLYQCNGTGAQQWEFAPDGTVQSLGKCLDVTGGDTNDGAKVQISDCNGAGAQRWAASTDGLIINIQANKCLDVPASQTADGTQLVIWTCHGETNQIWSTPA